MPREKPEAIDSRVSNRLSSFVTLSLSKGLCLFGLLVIFSVTANAKEFANIEYLCADWGPAMKLPSKEGEKVQFSETDEEIYFLKQVGRFTRGLTGEQGKGIKIYLCKMRPDGSGKSEIKELWHDVRYPIDTQAQSTWMDVNPRIKRIVLSVTYAGTDLTGLWLINLDGSDLKRIYSPYDLKGDVDTVNRPSWTPDGKWIVFDQHLKGVDLHQYRIARCDPDGKNLVRLTEGPDDRQPSVSPDGKQIAYIHWFKWASWLSLMNIDGANPHQLLNERGKTIGARCPTWSPDGKRIFGVGAGIIDVSSGKQLLYGRPIVQNWPQLNGKRANIVMPHWGRLGLLCSGWGGGIQLSDETLEKMWILASSDIQKDSKW